ncbi:hypothetical protein ADK38_46780 [Streptomyces varsoviensis]|uniref:Uncharacterized protein n=1 Tax=Streptomyces varsoviensis TaxID=67373 RepID=A0ABR5IR45_9ACTN|nr:hypothetical protein ADK38_46780 [Streptomyces varsoviensis]
MPALVTDFTVRDAALFIRTHPEGCFCATQRVVGNGAGGKGARGHRVGGNAETGAGDGVRGADDVCLYSGDVIAAALSAYTGSPYLAEQVTSAAAGDEEGCTFRMRPTDTEPLARILREFVARLDATRREPAPGLIPQTV